MAKVEEWKEKNWLVFFLSPYPPDLNRIEILLRRIKD
jgi:transposase